MYSRSSTVQKVPLLHPNYTAKCISKNRKTTKDRNREGNRILKGRAVVTADYSEMPGETSVHSYL